jgi:hypothetical protein
MTPSSAVTITNTDNTKKTPYLYLVLDFPCHEQQSESTADLKFQTKRDLFLDQELLHSLALETVTSLQGENRKELRQRRNKATLLLKKTILIWRKVEGTIKATVTLQ